MFSYSRTLPRTIAAMTLLSTIPQAYAQAPPPVCPAAAHLAADAAGASRAALVVSNPAALADKFSFASVIEKVLQSGGVEPSAEKADAFVQSMINTFAVETEKNGDVDMHLDKRQAELQLIAAEMLRDSGAKKLIPVGLFNRLDLAPSHWGNCGEFRVVFARPQEATSPPRQFLLIFEAKLPAENVGEALSLAERQARCRAVATFWAELAKLESDEEKVEKLAAFYFDGMALPDGKAMAPVISAANLGVEQGQVRGNLFLDQPWQLREWLVQQSADGLVFKLETVKSNPLAELYADAPAAGQDPDAKTLLWRQFNDDFVGAHVKELLTPELDDKTSNASELIANLGLNSSGPVNEFQSTSQGSDDDPLAKSPEDSRLRQSITTKIDQLGDKAKDITAEHILARAGAMTCGGCHRFSSDREIAPGVRWPSDLSFKHIDDKGELSLAVKNNFLPARMGMLKRTVCGEFGVPPAPATIAMAPSREGEQEDADIVAIRALRATLNAPVDQRGLRAQSAAEADASNFGETISRLERSQAGAFRRVRPVH